MIQAGVVGYKKSMLYISKETLEKAHKSIEDKPVFKDHNYKSGSIGKVLNATMAHDWIEGDFVTNEIYPKVSVGYSCRLKKNTDNTKIYNNLAHDYEVIDLKFDELSVISKNNQRYTNADVMFMRNSTDEDLENLEIINEIDDSVDNEVIRMYNCVDVNEIEKGNFTMFFNKVKQAVEGKDITDDSVLTIKNTTGENVEVTLGELKELPAKVAELEAQVGKVVIKNDAGEDEVYDEESIKELKKQSETTVVEEKEYSKEEVKEIIKEHTTADETIKNSIAKSSEISKTDSKRHKNLMNEIRKHKK